MGRMRSWDTERSLVGEASNRTREPRLNTSWKLRVDAVGDCLKHTTTWDSCT